MGISVSCSLWLTRFHLLGHLLHRWAWFWIQHCPFPHLSLACSFLLLLWTLSGRGGKSWPRCGRLEALGIFACKAEASQSWVSFEELLISCRSRLSPLPLLLGTFSWRGAVTGGSLWTRRTVLGIQRLLTPLPGEEWGQQPFLHQDLGGVQTGLHLLFTIPWLRRFLLALSFASGWLLLCEGQQQRTKPEQRGVRWSLVTLPTLWSLVTLPTSLGRVASDYFVLFSWPCSHENKARQISLFVVACDPTYFWGRVASDYFLALPTPPLVAWPYLLSDRLWPYRQFVTLAMGFAWQVQQFRCLRDVVPWPYTCLLGRVASDRHWLFVAVQYFRCLREVLCDPTSFLCGRCNIFVSYEKFFVVLRSFCVAGAIFSMPPRNSFVTRAHDRLWPHLLFAWQVQSFRCLQEVLRDTAKGCLWP